MSNVLPRWPRATAPVAAKLLKPEPCPYMVISERIATSFCLVGVECIVRAPPPSGWFSELQIKVGTGSRRATAWPLHSAWQSDFDLQTKVKSGSERATRVGRVT